MASFFLVSLVCLYSFSLHKFNLYAAAVIAAGCCGLDGSAKCLKLMQPIIMVEKHAAGRLISFCSLLTSVRRFIFASLHLL